MSNLTNSNQLIDRMWRLVKAWELANVAFSWAYSDLTWQPTLPTVNSNKIKFKKNWVQYTEITDNNPTDQIVNIDLTKVDVWLWNVDNTSDAQKPVSSAMLTELNKKADANSVYTKWEVDAAITQAVASTYRYKWSYPTRDSLPISWNTIWDVYNVTDTGINYAWDWTWWDPLGMVVDMSLYATNDYVNTNFATKTELQNNVDSINSNLTNNYYSKTYIDSNYYTKDQTNSSFYNKTEIDNSFYNKTEIDNKVSEITWWISWDITNIENEITNINWNITNIQWDITSIQWDITNIQWDITSIQWDISSLQTTVWWLVSNDPYSDAWDNDNTHAPSKNAVYDVIGNIHTLLANI